MMWLCDELKSTNDTVETVLHDTLEDILSFSSNRPVSEVSYNIDADGIYCINLGPNIYASGLFP